MCSASSTEKRPIRSMCAPVSSSRNSTAIDSRCTVSACAISSSDRARLSSVVRFSISSSRAARLFSPKRQPESDRRACQRDQASGHERGRSREDRRDDRGHGERHERKQRQRRVAVPGATARRAPARLTGLTLGAGEPTHQATDPRTVRAPADLRAVPPLRGREEGLLVSLHSLRTLASLSGPRYDFAATLPFDNRGRGLDSHVGGHRHMVSHLPTGFRCNCLMLIGSGGAWMVTGWFQRSKTTLPARLAPVPSRTISIG